MLCDMHILEIICPNPKDKDFIDTIRSTMRTTVRNRPTLGPIFRARRQGGGKGDGEGERTPLSWSFEVKPPKSEFE